MKNPSTPQILSELCKATIEKFIEQNKVKPTLDQLRNIRELAYAFYQFNEESDDGVEE